MIVDQFYIYNTTNPEIPMEAVMSKVLPINLNTGYTIHCGDFYRLSIITTSPQHLPWYMERFINIHMYDDTGSYLGLQAEIPIAYDEVLEQKPIPYKTLTAEKIRNIIKKESYLLLYLDEYYLQNSQSYQKKHKFHDILVYGYDDYDNYYYIGHRIKNQIWGKGVTSQNDLFRGMNSFSTAIENDSSLKDFYHQFFYLFCLPAQEISLQQSYWRDAPRLNVIAYGLEQYLTDGIRIHLTKEGSQKEYIGIHCYELFKVILEEDNFDQNQKVIWLFKILEENKQGILKKIEYIRNTYEKSEFSRIIEMVTTLCSLLETAKNLMIKYSQKSTHQLKSKLCSYLDKAEKLDQESTQILYEKFLTLYYHS